MTPSNGSEVGPKMTPDLFKWHGTELIFIPLMMVTGMVGNALVLYITHFRWKNSIFNFFIKTLAWLDMSNLVIAIPLLLVLTFQQDHAHDAFTPACLATTFVALFTAMSSAFVFVVIAANRFRKLCQPMRSQVTLPWATKLTIGCIIFGAVCSTPSLWIFGEDTAVYNSDVMPVNISICFIKDGVSLGLLLSWAVVMGGAFMTITAILVVLYSFAIVALRENDKRVANMMRRPSALSSNSRKVSRKHTLVFIAVTLVFFITYFPYFITLVLLVIDRSIEAAMDPVAKAFFDLARLFPLLGNVSNPIIYSFTSERFRAECKKVFKLRPCRKLLNLKRKDSVTHSHEMSQSEES